MTNIRLTEFDRHGDVLEWEGNIFDIAEELMNEWKPHKTAKALYEIIHLVRSSDGGITLTITVEWLVKQLNSIASEHMVRLHYEGEEVIE
jgi:hypothetical protein